MKISRMFVPFFTTLLFMFFSVEGMQKQNTIKEERDFLKFLSVNHYLDGSISISKKNAQYVIREFSRIKIDRIFENPILHSFAQNIAFVAAQVGEIDVAVSILVRAYNEDRTISNWLFDAMRARSLPLTEISVKKRVGGRVFFQIEEKFQKVSL